MRAGAHHRKIQPRRRLMAREVGSSIRKLELEKAKKAKRRAKLERKWAKGKR